MVERSLNFIANNLLKAQAIQATNFSMLLKIYKIICLHYYMEAAIYLVYPTKGT